MTLRFNLRNQSDSYTRYTFVETDEVFDLADLLNRVSEPKWMAVESRTSGNTVCFRTSDIASIVDKPDV